MTLAGKTAESKALLMKYGAGKLSEISKSDLAALTREAKVL